MKFSRLFLVLILLLTTINLSASDPAYYLGKDVVFNPDIPTPRSFMGYDVGEWHVRHDQLLFYMKALAEASDRVSIEEIGQTYEQRQLVHLTITSPQNHQRLEEIRTQHLELSHKGEAPVPVAEMPVIVNLGYSVHGDEPSGSNASLMVAYYLAAAEGIDDLLQNAVIILDPSLNPDGLSRFAQWANMHKSRKPIADNNHREHRQEWPSGRTNHYWFDLNRDWLLLQHPESRARVARFQKWMPNVLTDHHEMGTDSTFFFQPGIPSRQNPFTPAKNLDLTRMIARYHAEALDNYGQLYYSEQGFDDFYYGKGSTYPDVQGSIGILFEQGSSRGHAQDNSYGGITFPASIRNQVTTSLSTLKAALENRETLLNWQMEFRKQSKEKAGKDKVKGYVFHSETDPMRVQSMLEILRQHQIEVYHLARPLENNGKAINKGFLVPLEQRQYHLIKSLFEPVTTFGDETFYDVSTWHMPSAFDVEYISLDNRSFASNLMGEKIDKPTVMPPDAEIDGSHYAYILDWGAFYAPRAAARLLQNDIRVRFARQSFESETNQGRMSFEPGTLLVPMGIQKVDPKVIAKHLEAIVAQDKVPVYGVRTGLTPEGIDLGSPSMANLEMPKPLLLVGGRISQYGAGEIWHLLDQRFHVPLTISNVSRLGGLDLDKYTHIIAVNGVRNLGKSNDDKIAAWVKKGGVVIALQGAASWVSNSKMVNLKARKREEKKEPETIPYGDRSRQNAVHRIAGAILQGVADQTHPVCYGLDNDRLPLFRTTNSFFDIDPDPYSTPVRYSGTPLVSGYVSKENLELAKGSAAVIAKPLGRGAVVVMLDNPNFRAYWYGANKLVLNSLFFGSAIEGGRRR